MFDVVCYRCCNFVVYREAIESYKRMCVSAKDSRCKQHWHAEQCNNSSMLAVYVLMC